MTFGLLQAGAMVRRTPKPFTVEIRRSGRKPATAADTAHEPTLTFLPDDQPSVSWPGLDDAPEPAMAVERLEEAPRPGTGRILPALDEPCPAEQPPEPQHRQRKPARTKLPALEGIAAVSNAIEASEPVADRVGSEPVIQLADEARDHATLIASPRIIAATLLLRQGKKRLPRDQFTRGERWKARLPAAALASLGRPTRRPKGV